MIEIGSIKRFPPGNVWWRDLGFLILSGNCRGGDPGLSFATRSSSSHSLRVGGSLPPFAGEEVRRWPAWRPDRSVAAKVVVWGLKPGSIRL